LFFEGSKQYNHSRPWEAAIAAHRLSATPPDKLVEFVKRWETLSGSAEQQAWLRGYFLFNLLLVDRPPAGVTFRDLGAVRLRDLASPERVFQVLHPALRQEFPALRSLSSTPNNLPQQVTSFIGRERELSEVRRALKKGRLVTLLGTGGLGKTRLSLQAAADVLDDYPDGVWLVELAPVADARMVPHAIASVLGVKEETGHPVLEALAKAVKDRLLLIILDNCEHLLQACAETSVELLQAGPQMKILATSREPLNVAGENTYPLPALAVPDPQQKIPPSALSDFPAISLFVDRACAARDHAVGSNGGCAAQDFIPIEGCIARDRIPNQLDASRRCRQDIQASRHKRRRGICASVDSQFARVGG
jgi:hypothetical protein